MFDQKAFENKVYTLVTQEVNEAFSPLFKRGGESVQREGIKLQRKIIETLDRVAGEVTTQILCGILANTRTVRKIPFYSLKEQS